jgi:hypothetical protein
LLVILTLFASSRETVDDEVKHAKDAFQEGKSHDDQAKSAICVITDPIYDISAHSHQHEA